MAGDGSARPPRGAVDAGEVGRFDSLAESWWDPGGPLAPLHAMNPARLGFIRERAVARFGRDPAAMRPLEGLRALDVGCGAGLVAEPLARMGAEVTAIDAAPAPLEEARRRAGRLGLGIDYRSATVEEAEGGLPPFDLVTALEVVEHVPDRRAFLAAAAGCVAPGGLLVLSTLNRTLRSLAGAIVAAEWVLGVVPRGTHRFSRFVRPSEVAEGLSGRGMAVEAIRGLSFRPLSREWRVTGDPSVNYLVAATRSAREAP